MTSWPVHNHPNFSRLDFWNGKSKKRCIVSMKALSRQNSRTQLWTRPSLTCFGPCKRTLYETGESKRSKMMARYSLKTARQCPCRGGRPSRRFLFTAVPEPLIIPNNRPKRRPRLRYSTAISLPFKKYVGLLDFASWDRLLRGSNICKTRPMRKRTPWSRYRSPATTTARLFLCWDRQEVTSLLYLSKDHDYVLRLMNLRRWLQEPELRKWLQGNRLFNLKHLSVEEISSLVEDTWDLLVKSRTL